MEYEKIWKKYSQTELKKLEKLNAEYIDFLSEGKTERECVDRIVNLAEANGYVELDKLIGSGKKLKTGDKVYTVWMNKSVCMFRIGKKPFSDGMNILGAHIDSPRMDVKSNPLYEKDDFALLDTHYYGGIKKYQYTALPLAIHGVVVKKDGSTVEINIGEDPDDPVFFVSDLLIHLAQDQMEKKGSKVVEGEDLDVIVGNKPIALGADVRKNAKVKEEKKDSVKNAILKILKEQYDFEEKDFYSAELELVPAGRAREAGFDRSMILSYGQDDRVCAFTSLKAMLDLPQCDRTICTILVDKEEIGSVGATGMRSKFFENAVAEVMNLCGEYNSEIDLKRALSRSCMLSSDVSAGVDPNYESVFEKKNAAFLGGGIVFNKFTGSRGKSGSNDANAEYIAAIRRVFEDAGISYQFAELGKVDQGGGGTIAYILALYGMNVIDSGVAVLNMHSPWEATSKADVYETYKGYIAFCKGMDL
ncbi:MAG: aminopeptidase [Lachnospiraceae bacterium]|nr:aminopeptidase [Lachnospiraceae bacterium]